jgi:hypothetical protein
LIGTAAFAGVDAAASAIAPMQRPVTHALAPRIPGVLSTIEGFEFFFDLLLVCGHGRQFRPAAGQPDPTKTG